MVGNLLYIDYLRYEQLPTDITPPGLNITGEKMVLNMHTFAVNCVPLSHILACGGSPHISWPPSPVHIM